MKRKGVCYDVGRVLEDAYMRPTFDADVVRRELEVIKHDLHCNAVRICGLDTNRLTTTAETALKLGLEVWLSPEIFEQSQQETFDYIVKCAEESETLRESWPQQLVLSIGSELTLFMQGIIEGANLMERMRNPSFWENIRAGVHNKPLNEFLTMANEAVTQVFHGKVTYMSAPLETVDWSIFDFACVDMFREARIKDSYGDLIKRYLAHKKPVIIGAFGCCTYKGAEEAGGRGWAIVEFNKATSQLQLNRD